MRPRTDGDRIAGDVEAEVGAHLADVRKPLAHQLGIEMRQVEIHAGVPRLFHLHGDRMADFIARGQLELRRIIPHEAIPGAVAQIRPFAPDRFGNQVPRAARRCTARSDETA